MTPARVEKITGGNFRRVFTCSRCPPFDLSPKHLHWSESDRRSKTTRRHPNHGLVAAGRQTPTARQSIGCYVGKRLKSPFQIHASHQSMTDFATISDKL